MNNLKNRQKTVHNCSLIISLLKENLQGSYPIEKHIYRIRLLSYLDFFLERKSVIVIR